MKVSITPTESQIEKKFPHFSVSVENPNDELTATELLDLMVAAMQAMGFDLGVIRNALDSVEL